MTRKATNTAKAIGAVMAAGSAAVMLAATAAGKNNTKKQIKKTADKAVKTVNGILDGIQGVM